VNYWSRIGGAVVLAYLVFTTIKGNLRSWLEIIGLKPDSGSVAGATTLRGKS